MEFGATMLPTFMRDNTDRNRTSPLAFTGNRFEFRMTGSNMSIGDACYVLNTIVAESFRQFADRLEQADDVETEVKLSSETFLQNIRNYLQRRQLYGRLGGRSRKEVFSI